MAEQLNAQSKASILVAEDDPNILGLLDAYLNSSGFDVACATDGKQALELFKQRHFDLAILDVMMPEMDGFEVLNQIRHFSQAQGIGRGPGVLMLTARGAEEDRLEGFETGADDYVVKPFSPRELVARVKAVLARSVSTTTSQPAVEASEQTGLSVDQAAKRCYFEGRDLDLTRSEFRLMAHLCGRPGQVYSRAELIEAVDPEGFGGFEKSIDVHIHNVRKKIGPLGDEILKTVRGFGYRVQKASESLGQ